MRFINSPNLPEADVALAAMSGTYPKIINALRRLNIIVLPVKPCKKIGLPVCTHADMLCHHLGDNAIVVAKGEEYLKAALEQNGFHTVYSCSVLEKNYPKDVALNAARIGRNLIANQKALDTVIVDYCKKHQISILSTKQGYAKCSSVIVSENAVITEDSSIAAAAAGAAIQVLKIRPGFVKLDGYEYGFLGGACGMIGKNKLVFAGSIESHPDYCKIKAFCRNLNVQLLSLTEDPLTDVGGILPLKTFG
ncbi:DUF6873 family GME fold protein [Caproiciproducens galactitolivorans]|uniref:DUF6873 domain-containing protein n=1 Tax=Caproiciproducens galactitolivorans TaxID=642589 RepID=A0ABT4BT54_9FIRM|nr:hypothetical protein [Caproiciproducens galactitolivorans]MCY1713258.1 hypothetical protein [Caproiciproducens galactitolivorans]